MRKVLTAALLLLLVGCSVLAGHRLNEKFGPPDPARYDTPRTHPTINYTADIQPILERRCVVCHACYDAPCQLKVTAYEGITRGASKERVYHAERLLAAPPSRLFEDASSTAQWRKKDFFPVLNERANTSQANISGSTMAQMLLLKSQHPLPEQALLPDEITLGLYRDEQCPKIEEFEHVANKNPLWGMPYGLPGLNPKEQMQLLNWLSEGAPFNGRPQPSQAQLEHIRRWESFFNQNSLKAQLMSRYMYEHLFLAHLYFEDEPPELYFELVRSTTPPGEPIERISTRRPFDYPGTGRVYYRLQPIKESIVAKTHMPYPLNGERMNRWSALFLNDSYTVSQLPSYAPKTASNPFVTFEQIPAYARYRFMLEEAQFTIMGFIKGPVCRGQLALNVINDYFWVTFVSPEIPEGLNFSEFMSDALKDTSLPAESQSNATPWRWLKYADEEKAYLEAKSRFLKETVEGEVPIDLNGLWDGDGQNPNAALTVFRHFDSASVVQGLIGSRPQTAWVISYPLLERIHYLLVAGYDVYGNVGHQLNNRIYMDFLRMEGEYNFLSLLPKDQRETVRQHWYRGAIDLLKEHVYQRGNRYEITSAVAYQTDDPLTELYSMIKDTLLPVTSQRYDLAHGFSDPSAQRALQRIQSVTGRAAAILPQTAVLKISSPEQTHYYTLLSNNAYSNISDIYGEQDRRLPEEDTLTLVYGIIGAYPSVLMDVPHERITEFATAIGNIRSERHYQALLDQFGIRRTNPEFWAHSDDLHNWYFAQYPLSAGLLDYNRLENR